MTLGLVLPIAPNPQDIAPAAAERIRTALVVEHEPMVLRLLCQRPPIARSRCSSGLYTLARVLDLLRASPYVGRVIVRCPCLSTLFPSG